MSRIKDGIVIATEDGVDIWGLIGQWLPLCSNQDEPIKQEKEYINDLSRDEYKWQDFSSCGDLTGMFFPTVTDAMLLDKAVLIRDTVFIYRDGGTSVISSNVITVSREDFGEELLLKVFRC